MSLVHQFREALDAMNNLGNDWISTGATDFVHDTIPDASMTKTNIVGDTVELHNNPDNPGEEEPKAQEIQTPLATVDSELLSQTFSDLLQDYGFDDIGVQVVDDGLDCTATLIDDAGDTEVVVFGVDPINGATAVVAGHNGEDDDESTMIDLDYLEPAYTDEGRLDMLDLNWMNKTTLLAIIAPLEMSDETVECGERFSVAKFQLGELIDEGMLQDLKDKHSGASGTGKRYFGRMKSIVHGGRKLRVPVVIKTHKHKLSSRQHEMLSKAMAGAAAAKDISRKVKSFVYGA